MSQEEENDKRLVEDEVEEVHKYYESYREMFQTEGWKTFVSETEQSIKDNFNYDDAKDYEEFIRMQAARHQLQRIISFEHFMEFNYETFKEGLNDINPGEE